MCSLNTGQAFSQAPQVVQAQMASWLNTSPTRAFFATSGASSGSVSAPPSIALPLAMMCSFTWCIIM